MQHARLGASKAHRWMACSGSPWLSEKYPDEPSEYAIEGSAAHDVAERCLNEGTEPDHYVGEIINVQVAEDEYVGVEFTDDMADAVQVYVDFCREQAGDDPELEDRQTWVERTVSLEALKPPEPMFGTADFIMWHAPSRHLHMVDYKNGAGVVVEVQDNPQTLMYALGAVLEIGKRPETITCTIVQPNAPHPDGPIRSATYTYEELVEFKKELMAAAQRVHDKPNELRAGSHCKFCPAFGECPAARDEAYNTAVAEFSAEDPLDIELIQPREIGEILSAAEFFEEWIRAVRSRALELMDRHATPIPGWKVVKSNTHRRWADEEKADQYLAGKKITADDRYKKTLISPAQAERLLTRAGHKGRLEFLNKRHIIKPEGQPRLAPADDPRPAIPSSVEDDFDYITQEEE